MSTLAMIPLLPGNLNGETAQLVDARHLHAFLGVGRDFSTWIKGRTDEYDFVEQHDYLLTKTGEQVPSGTKWRVDYFLALDMAKELAMVERTAKGREARRDFIDCERQLRRLSQGLPQVRRAVPVDLTRAERQAINRQAWAEVSGEVYAAFHARREALLETSLQAKAGGPAILLRGYHSPRALKGGAR
jgi:anti-repressor protein